MSYLYSNNVSINNSNNAPITTDMRLPVDIGNASINISGNVNINTPNTVTVNSTPQNPVHTHITEVGNANIQGVPYIPVQGNVYIYSSNGSAITNTTPLPVTSALNPVAFDAFGRQRMSTPLTLFDSSHRYRDNNLWSTSNSAGTTYTHSINQGIVELTLPTTLNAEIVRETTKVFAYQPGKSLLVMSTFVPATPKINLRQRIGYFGAQNGIYFEIDGTTAYFVERSYVTGALVETRVAQSQWSENTLPILDKSKAQILWMDIEWLGLGTVRCGFVIDGKFVHCHSFHHANLIESTYITTACLPLRYEIKNTGVTTSNSTLKQVCSTVISEGGYELRGLQQAIGIPINSPRTLGTAGTFYPVIGLRLKASPDRLDAIAILTALSIMPIATGAYNWQMRASGTITGGTWTSAGVDSAVEYNLTGTSQTGGRILASGFFSASNQGSTQIDILKEALFKFQLERNGLTGTPFELALVVASNSSDDTLVASMDWEEISR